VKAIPELSPDTRLLYQRLRELKPEEVIPYKDLSGLIGRNVQERARSTLNAARKKALRDDHVVTEAVINVGIKRLADVRIVETTGDAVRRRIRRASSRGVLKLTSVNFDALSPQHRIKHNAELSQLGALREFSKDSQTKRIEKIISGNDSAPLAIAQTLATFSS
jgi:hypothetical protein